MARPVDHSGQRHFARGLCPDELGDRLVYRGNSPATGPFWVKVELRVQLVLVLR